MRRRSIDADVGGDARQQHVARDQHPELGAVEAGVLGCVAEAHDDAPGVGADAQLVAGEHALVAPGHLRCADAVGVAAGQQRVATHLIEAMAAELLDHVGCAVAGQLVPHRLGGEEFALRHVDRGVVACGQPGRQADVIRVVMRHHHPAQWPAVRGEHGVPRFARLLAGKAAVDDRERLAVVEQPQVDVIKREGQAHAYPAQAGGDLDRVPGCRQVVEGVGESRKVGAVHEDVLSCAGARLRRADSRPRTVFERSGGSELGAITLTLTY